MTSIGRDKTFLNYFYDLALDDKQARLNAANALLVHVKSALQNNQPSDPEYALKRLVRGLSSSRDSARQGFATCLCEMLVLPEIDNATCLEVLDENTKLTGSLKGSEERDYMFAKLFCYLSIVRSGKLTKDTDASVKLLERILELHTKRGWIREVGAESILIFVSAVSSEAIVQCLPKILVLLNDIPLADMAAWQLTLLVGLQNIAAKNSKFSTEWEKSNGQVDLFDMTKLDQITQTLIASTAGFPKLHRVWDYILSFIVPMDSENMLKSHRLKSLKSSQESSLVTFSRFIDQHLITSSKEKRGVAMTLATTLVRLVPAEYLPVALSKSVVRSFYAARTTKKHALRDLAGALISEMVSSAVGETQSRLALVSVLVQFGGANFDVHTGTKAVSTLLEGMSAAETASHIQLLCTEIGSSSSNSDAVAVKTDEGEDEEVEDPSSSSAACASLEALSSIARNSRIAGRSDIVSQVVTVLVRLSCFESGTTKAPKAVTETPSKKAAAAGKGGKKRKGSDLEAEAEAVAAAVAASTVLTPVVLANIAASEAVLAGSSADEVSELAVVKLLALLAEVGSSTLHQLDTKPAADASKDAASAAAAAVAVKEVDNTPTVLQVAWNTLKHLTKAGLTLSDSSAAEEEEGQEQEEGSLYPTDFVKHIETAYASNAALVQAASGEEGKAVSNKNKLIESLSSLLLQSAFYALTSSEIELGTVKVIADISKEVIEPATASNNDEDDEEEEEEDALIPLFGACMDLLSVPSEHSIKGLRDAIKRVWSSVCHIRGDSISYNLIDSVMDAVIGDDADDIGQAGEDQEEDDGGSDQEEEEQEESESEEEQEEVAAPAKGKKNAKEDNKNGKKENTVDKKAAGVPPASPVVSPKTSKKNSNKKAVPAEEEEDILLNESEAMDLLGEDMNDLDDEDFEASLQMVQHSGEHDEALAQMIAMRKQNRKQGLLQARRRQMLIRSRAIDILEIIINRVELGDLLYPMYLPLLKCLSKVKASTLTQSLSEGKSFTHRLSTVLEQKLCKKRFHLIGDNDETAEASIMEESQLLLSHLLKQLTSPHPELRQVAHSCLLSVSRAIISSDCAAVKELLVNTITPVFTTFCTKKNHRYPVKLVDDLLLNRFSDFFAPFWLPVLVKSIGGAATQAFTRSELCRILGSILKKFQSLSGVTKEVVQKSLGDAVTALGDAVEAMAVKQKQQQEQKKSEGDESTAVLGTKRFKPLLICIKDILDFVKKQQLQQQGGASGSTPGKKGKANTSGNVLQSVQKLQRTLASHHDEHAQSPSPVVVKLVEQITETIANLSENKPAQTADSKKVAAEATGKRSAEAVAHQPSNEEKKNNKKQKKDKK